MDSQMKQAFLDRWNNYFPGAELPIVFYYTDNPGSANIVEPPSERRCFLADLTKVRNGRSAAFSVESVSCFGGKRYLGFTEGFMPGFEYFLSCGIPGKMEGERYKKSPELVRQLVADAPTFRAPAKFIVFKRWDTLEPADNPDVVIFFAKPDVLAGLFTLANYDRADANGVFTPFAAGCNTIVQHPYLEKAAPNPRCVLGMFDVSARPCVPADTLSFAVPMEKFVKMIDDMDESFLITGSWARVKKRLAK